MQAPALAPCSCPRRPWPSSCRATTTWSCAAPQPKPCVASKVSGQAAGLNPADWTPRELRHSFVSLLSDSEVSINDIADLCGHSGTSVTEKVYRHELRPFLLTGAAAMDRIFALDATARR